MICFLVVSLVQATTVLAEVALLQSTASVPRQNSKRAPLLGFVLGLGLLGFRGLGFRGFYDFLVKGFLGFWV